MHVPRAPRLPLVLGLFGLVACAAPTLPLPPPDTELAWNAQGILEVRGSNAEAGSLCFCLNEDRNTGTIVRADDGGSFECELPGAEPGDIVTAWYEIGFDKSQPSSKAAPPRPE